MMRRTYIHEQHDWPRFHWRQEGLVDQLAAVRHRQGRLLGRMESHGFDLRQEAVLDTLTEDVVTSSEIEGEMLDAAQVRSSVARRLGMDIGGLGHVDRSVDGIVELMLDATERFTEPLTQERLFGWHAALFPTGRSGMRRIAVGGWRDDSTGPMQVVSGPIGRERVHFEAPSGSVLDREMQTFLEWFNAPAETDEVLRASLAHLWFVTVHPFDDGNGRIARAIADMALARSEGSPQRFYSMSLPNSEGAGSLLQGPGADAEGNDGRLRMDGLVPSLPGPGHRRRRGDPRGGAREGPVLGADLGPPHQ